MAHRVPKKEFGHAETIGKKIPIMLGANFNDDPICRNSTRKSHTLGKGADLQPQVDSEDTANYAPHTAYDFAGGDSSAVHGTIYDPMFTSSKAYGTANGMNSTNNSTMKSSTWKSPMGQGDLILRFLGYFMESVPESPDEKTRVRRVGIIYHVNDKTLIVREAKQTNSGMPQGVILKRQRVPNPEDPSGNAVFEPKDFALGSVVNIFGKQIHLVDVDENTRRYCREELGIEMPETALPWPSEQDTYTTTAQKKLTMMPKRALPTTDFDHKRVNESMLSGGIITKHAPDDVRTAQQFHRNKINEHLSFLALRDDRAKKSGDLRKAVVRYYLENDTVEIVEARPDNSGREGGNKLLNRQRIPADPSTQPSIGAVSGPAQQNTFGLLLKNGYMNYESFAPGKNLKVYSHEYFIYDADSFTRGWWQQNLGRDFGPAVDVSDTLRSEDVELPKQYPPPHMGFGSEDDSLQSWKSLMLKPPRIDTNKLARENGKVMLFRASFANALQPEDAERQFLISFHRATDEVEIVERQVRNSGIIGGKFLAKGKHLKTLPDGRSVPFSPQDFVVGNVVEITGRAFYLSEIDERSRKQCDGEEEEVSEDRVKDLIVQLKEQLNSKYVRIHEAYRAIAPQGVLTTRELRDFFDHASGPISQEEAVCLVRYFAGDDEGTVSYPQFVQMMDVKNSHNLDESSNSRRAIKNVKVMSRASEEAIQANNTIRAKCDRAVDVATQRQLRSMLVNKLVQRRGTVQEIFRLMAGHAANNRMTRAAFERGLVDVLHVSLPPERHELLVRLLFDDATEDERGIPFTKFFQFVESE